MLITEKQIKNDYPLEAVRFLQNYDRYLSDELDEYGIKKCKPDSFAAFSEVGASYPKRLKEQYDESVEAVHKYLDKGNEL